MGGDSKSSNQTSTVIPWKGVQPYLLDAFTQFSNTKAPQYFPESTVARQSPDTVAGINNLGPVANQQQTIANTAGQGYDFTLNKMLDPASNTYLSKYAEGAVRPVFDQLNNVTLPGINREAVVQGGMGGTAQAKLQTDALDKATRNAMDITSGIYSNAYENSLDNYTKTLLGTGLVQDATARPVNTTLQQGGLQDNYAQTRLNDSVNRWNQQQTGEFDYLQQYISTLLGMPMGSNVAAPGGETSLTQNLLSGGALGYGAGAAFGATNPALWALYGAGAMGLLN